MADNSAWLPVIRARVADDVLIPLTNESSETQAVGVVVVEALLQLAIDDAIGMFLIHSRVAAVVTNVTHIPIILKGTMFFLTDYKMPGQNREAEDKFRYACLDIKDQLTNTSVTTADTTPTDPTRGGTVVVRPDSDRSRFCGYLPGSSPNRRFDF